MSTAPAPPGHVRLPELGKLMDVLDEQQKVLDAVRRRLDRGSSRQAR